MILVSRGSEEPEPAGTGSAGSTAEEALCERHNAGIRLQNQPEIHQGG